MLSNIVGRRLIGRLFVINRSRLDYARPYFSRSTLSCLLVLSIAVATACERASGEYVTFGFAGAMSPATFDFGIDFNPGDPFRGYYTFDATAVGVDHPDPSADVQYHLSLIDWEFLFPTKGYRFVGTDGSIIVGDNTAFGDLYIVTLFSPASVGIPLPSGRMASFLQLDLRDGISEGADFLLDDSIQTTVPNLALVGTSAGGRFLFTNDDQPHFDLTELSQAPEPGGTALAACATISVLLLGPSIYRRSGRCEKVFGRVCHAK